VREQARDLVGARDARARDAVRGQARELAPVERDAARVGAVVAADDVDQRRLARAVGAEHAEDLAFAHVEVDAVERAHAANALRTPRTTRSGRRRRAAWSAARSAHSRLRRAGAPSAPRLRDTRPGCRRA
jgi:hypothetical protein